MQGSDLTPWLQRLKEGDKEAFRYVYDLTVDNVYRTVALLVSGRQDIEDIMNEIYLKLWLSLPNYDPSRPFRNWLHGITIRQVQDWRRKNGENSGCSSVKSCLKSSLNTPRRTGSLC